MVETFQCLCRQNKHWKRLRRMLHLYRLLGDKTVRSFVEEAADLNSYSVDTGLDASHINHGKETAMLDAIEGNVEH